MTPAPAPTSSSSSSSGRLEDRLRTSLERRAAAIAVGADRFDPTRAGLGDLVPEPLPSAARRSPRWARAGAGVAAAALVAVAVGVVVTRADPEPRRDVVAASTTSAATATAPTTPSTAPPAADDGPVPTPGVVPTAVPDGLDLWSVEPGRQSSTSSDRTQLFSTEDGTGQVLVIVTPESGSQGYGTALTVRGQAATASPSKELPDRSTTVLWNEGATIEARYLGLDQGDAVALLEGLTWRSADHLDGFDAGPGSRQLGDAAPGEHPYRSVELTYRDGPEAVSPRVGRQLTVRTSRSAAGTTAAHLVAWYGGTEAADGRVSSFDPDFGTLQVSWPDGRAAWIDANGTPATEAQLQQVADGLHEVDGAALLALRTDAEAHEADVLPVEASADLTTGVVELRRSGEAEVRCLLVPGHPRRCGAPDADPGDEGSFLIGGQWYLVLSGSLDERVATRAPTSAERGVLPDDAYLRADQRTVGDVRLAVVRLPADLDEAYVNDGAGGSAVARRPVA